MPKRRRLLAEDLKVKADSIRQEIIRVSLRNNAGHIAPSLSCVDILTALYYRVMKFWPQEPLWENRDRLIFSKGHGCYGLYAILADIGVIPKQEWENFYTLKSSLSGCVERRPEYGLEAGCGSLGHGLPLAVGIALGARLQKKTYHTFCLTGDGEMQEGSNWEALQFAVKHKLDNLIIIVDYNRLQALDFTLKIMDRKETALIERLRGFGLKPVLCPGNNPVKLADCLMKAKGAGGEAPKVIIAKTTKGFGLRCMENKAKFHYRVPSVEELRGEKSYEATE